MSTEFRGVAVSPALIIILRAGKMPAPRQ